VVISLAAVLLCRDSGKPVAMKVEFLSYAVSTNSIARIRLVNAGAPVVVCLERSWLESGSLSLTPGMPSIYSKLEWNESAEFSINKPHEPGRWRTEFLVIRRSGANGLRRILRTHLPVSLYTRLPSTLQSITATPMYSDWLDP
jgi:hypothetical protein